MQRYGQDVEFDPSAIIKRENGPYVLHSDAMVEIDRLKADNEILRNMNKILKNSIEATSAKLSRLNSLPK